MNFSPLYIQRGKSHIKTQHKFKERMDKVMGNNEKLAECLKEAMELDIEKLREEMNSMDRHVFSKEFEKKMEDIFTVSEKKLRPFPVRRLAAAAAVLIVAFGVFGMTAKQANASKPGIDILAWVKEYFNFEKGDDSRHNSDVLFEEAQISYIPEGFKKVEEEVSFSTALYKYINDSDDYIGLEVSRGIILYNQDGQNVEYILKENDAGFEYAYTYKEAEEVHIIIWEDEKGIFYRLSGSGELEELVLVMNGIR